MSERRWSDDLSEWLQSLRFSALTVAVVVIAIVGALVLSPSLTIYLQQQREIAQLRESVELHRQSLSEMEAEQLKWEDPVYIRAQARDRLYYVMPGEVQLSVIDDGVVVPDDRNETITAELTKTERNWALGIASSVLQAGTTSQRPNELQRK